MTDDYRRLMMVKSPSEQQQQAKRYTILSDNFSKISVKQVVALQSGLGQGGMLNRDLSKVSGGNVGPYVDREQTAKGSRAGGGAQRQIIKFTKDKRPVSSYNPPGAGHNQLGAQAARGGKFLGSRDNSVGPTLQMAAN